jgi:membrane-associated phospholipid phosphatase
MILMTSPRARAAAAASRALRALACTILAVQATFVSARPLQAQAPPDTTTGRTIVPRDTADAARHQTLFTYRDGALAAGFAGLTVLMFPADRHIAERLQDEDLQANKFFEKSATGVEVITTPGAFVIGGGLYVFGRVAGHPNIADLGWHGTEAVLVASGISNVLKGLMGRSRPYFVGDTIPSDFHFGKGFSGGSDRQSFPSGHSTTAFAAAAAVTSETRRLWPKAVWYVAPVMYGGATFVGLSRMYHNRHWASDVVLGAAIGTFSGLKVVRYSHAHPDNVIDRLILGASVAPDGHGGGVLSFSLPTP